MIFIQTVKFVWDFIYWIHESNLKFYHKDEKMSVILKLDMRKEMKQTDVEMSGVLQFIQCYAGED